MSLAKASNVWARTACRTPHLQAPLSDSHVGCKAGLAVQGEQNDKNIHRLRRFSQMNSGGSFFKLRKSAKSVETSPFRSSHSMEDPTDDRFESRASSPGTAQRFGRWPQRWFAGTG